MSDTDLDLIRRARERSRNIALHGTTEAQAGLVDEYLSVKRYAEHILREAQSAMASWSHWEAINDAFDDSDTGRAVVELELGAIGWLRSALVRDAVLQAYKLSDPFKHPLSEIYLPNKEKTTYSLCGIAKLLDEAGLRTKLSSREWALDLGHYPEVADLTARENTARIDRLRKLIKAEWVKSSAESPEFANLRTSVKPLRDRVLAHSLGNEATLSRPTIDQTRGLIRLTLDLATDMALLFSGSAIESEAFTQFAREQAATFWSYAFKAPRAEYVQHRALRTVDHSNAK